MKETNQQTQQQEQQQRSVYLTPQEVRKLTTKAKKILTSCNIPYADVPIKTNTRLKRSLGRYCEKSYYGITQKWIDLSLQVLNSKLPSTVPMNTILHELIHTCKNCQNHGTQFLTYCNTVNVKYPEYQLQRYTTEDESKIIREAELQLRKEALAKQTQQDISEIDNLTAEVSTYRYFVSCNECHAVWKRQSMSKLVKYADQYRCGCGGTLNRITRDLALKRLREAQKKV